MTNATGRRRVVTRAGIAALAMAFGTSARAAYGTFSSSATNSLLLSSGTLSSIGLSSGTISIINHGSLQFQSSNLYTTIRVHQPDRPRTVDVEASYLPHILQVQKDAAGFNINPEALKAITVADRSQLYFTVDPKGFGGGDGSLPEYVPSIAPQSFVANAVQLSEREILQQGVSIISAPIISGPRPSSLAAVKQARVLGKLDVGGADFLADHGWNYQDILRFYYGPAQLTLANDKCKLTRTYSAPAGTKMLADFENGQGIFQSSGATTNTLALTHTKAHSGDTAELITIDTTVDYVSHPYQYRTLAGITGAEGSSDGNMLLPAGGNIGFYLRTTTPGLKAQISVNDTDGAEKSVPKKIVPDGKWHKYSWDIGTDANWNPAESKANGFVSGPFTLNSLYLTGHTDASVRIDDVFFTEAPNVPSVSYGSGLTKTGSGTLILGGNNNYTGAVTINGGTLAVGNIGTFASNLTINNSALVISNAGTLVLANSALATVGNSFGTLTFGGSSFNLAHSIVGSITFSQGGTITGLVGGTTNLTISPGTELSSLGNGAMLLSGGTFGDGGILILNSGTLTLTDASVASQYASLAQSSGLVGTVLAPEPISIGAVAMTSPLLMRRRRRF